MTEKDIMKRLIDGYNNDKRFRETFDRILVGVGLTPNVTPQEWERVMKKIDKQTCEP